MLEWIGVEFSSSSTPIHPNTCGLMRIRLHPNKALGCSEHGHGKEHPFASIGPNLLHVPMLGASVSIY